MTTAITAKPEAGRLLSQWKLLLLATKDKSLSRGDLGVLAEIVDRHRMDAGNARASINFLARAVDLSRQSVITSTRKLLERGYVSVSRLGTGTRPTEYKPAWDFASGQAELTPASGQAELSTGGNQTSLLDGASGLASLTESYLLEPADSRLTESNTTTHADSAPTLTGTAPAPRDPFEELWEAYGLKHKRKEARRAFVDLAPDEKLTATLLAKAAEWRAAYDAEPVTDKSFRVQLSNWLAGEKWLEDIPLKYVDRRAAAIAARPSGTKAGVSEGPVETYELAEIIDVKVPKRPGFEHLAIVTLQSSKGTVNHRLVTSNEDGTAGPDDTAWRSIWAAAGVEPSSDLEDLVGRSVQVGPRGARYFRPEIEPNA